MQPHTDDPSTAAEPAPRIPAVDYLVLDEAPHLRSRVCLACRALYFDRRNACSRCFATEFGHQDLADTGEVTAFTIVSRAAKSVPTPYTSVVVALDGGGYVKSTLLGESDPARLTPGLRVRLTTFVAGTDDDGVQAIAFGYQTDGASA